MLRASVRFPLERAGYEVLEACDGRTGLDALETLPSSGKRPAMIITDVNMPVMDGITFVRDLPLLLLLGPFQEQQLVDVTRKLIR